MDWMAEQHSDQLNSHSSKAVSRVHRHGTEVCHCRSLPQNFQVLPQGVACMVRQAGASILLLTSVTSSINADYGGGRYYLVTKADSPNC